MLAASANGIGIGDGAGVLYPGRLVNKPLAVYLLIAVTIASVLALRAIPRWRYRPGSGPALPRGAGS